MERNYAVNRLVERDECFGTGYTGNFLDAVVKELHKVLVVARIEFDEHGVWAGGEVTFYNFEDFFEFGHDFTVHGSAFEVDTHIGAGRVTECLGVDVVSRAGDDLHIDKALDALMDSCARNAARDGDIFRSDAGIAHYDTENFAVKVVDFFHRTGLYENWSVILKRFFDDARDILSLDKITKKSELLILFASKILKKRLKAYKECEMMTIGGIQPH